MRVENLFFRLINYGEIPRRNFFCKNSIKKLPYGLGKHFSHADVANNFGIFLQVINLKNITNHAYSSCS